MAGHVRASGREVGRVAGEQERPPPEPGHIRSVVGIGASAGGLNAFKELLSHLQTDAGLSYVLVQHLDPEHESILPQLLARATPMPVQQITDGTEVQPDHVYVIPPNVTMVITQGILRLAPRDTLAGPNRSIDIFLQSLAQDQAERAIGVILSGTASDGVAGLEAIKAEGGITFAQDERSADFDSMPHSAIAAGCVDFVLAPADIAQELSRLARHPYLNAGASRPPAKAGAPGNDLKKVLSLLHAATGVDFSCYKPATLERRIGRRMLLCKIKTRAAYAAYLRGHPEEVQRLYQDVLISVTSFFRDPGAYEVLRREVLPKLLRNRRENQPVRIWVVGCSTGQEAYSIAMSFLECADDAGADTAPILQLFATDLNEDLLKQAREGFYSKALLHDVSAQRLRRFFVEEEGGYRVAKAVRERCVFARQSVFAEPPLSRMDLISCRNVLIYIEQDVQRQILSTLHYALNPGGFLWLGQSETTGALSDLFIPIAARWRVYAKKAQSPRRANRPAARLHVHAKTVPGKPTPVPPDSGYDLEAQREADRVALSRYAPVSVLVNEQMEILQFRGDTSPYLTPPRGRASLNLLRMAREGLMLPLRAVVTKAIKSGRTARREQATIRSEGQRAVTSLMVIPLTALKHPCYLVVFEPAAGLPRVVFSRQARTAKAEADGPGMTLLKRELAETRQYIQSLQDQYEASVEQLQAASEEAQSGGEELQSINEELETSKEELESANEELNTVNTEMTHRNGELNRTVAALKRSKQAMKAARDYSEAIIATVREPLVVLDEHFRVKTASRAFYQVFHASPAETERRSIFELSNRQWDIPALRILLEDVVRRKGNSEDFRVEHAFGGRGMRTMLLNARAFSTEGTERVLILVAFQDITELERLNLALSDATGFAQNANRAKDDFLAVLSHELRTPLTPVLTAASMLDADRQLPDRYREDIDMIRRNVELEARLIDDLLDVTRITRGKAELDRRPIALSQVIHRAVEVCKGDIQTRELEFGVDMGDAAACLIDADATRLQQVFWNLLRNAIKFTPCGGCVGIRCRMDGDGRVLTEVSDSGAGIDPEVLPRLFNAFEQGGIHTTRQFGGLGLGLMISKGLVELHGGTIEACSAGKGKGATFRVSLPLHRREEASQCDAGGNGAALGGETAAAPVSPLRILLVEDHGDTAIVMKRLLMTHGHEVQTAGDVATALKLAGSGPFDLVISDLGLPDGSGVELMRELRQRGCTVPGIALSGYGHEEDMRRTSEAGFGVHLTKPISPAQLTEAIALITGTTSTPNDPRRR